jgi:uncharacterized protein with HEPN domain
VGLVENKTRASLDNERVLCLALIRLPEVSGEAANRIGREQQEKHPAIPWQPLIALRNRLIHGYDSVDYDVMWQILSKD